MTCFEEHGRCIAIILWLFCVALMIADVFCQFNDLEHFKIYKLPVAAIFLAVSCGTPIFRVFGANLLVKILHFLLSILPCIFIFLLYEDLSTMALGILLFFIILQFCASVCMFCICRGHTPAAYAFRVGLHALFGVITIVVYYLICCCLLKPDINHGSAVVEAFYLLLLLMILLTPAFQAPSQAIPQAREAHKDVIRKAKELRGAKHSKRRSKSDSSPRSRKSAEQRPRKSSLKK